MFGSARRMSTTFAWCATIASNPIPWTPSVCTEICPMSWLGMNPVGIFMKHQIVATRSSSETTIVTAWWVIACRRVQA